MDGWMDEWMGEMGGWVEWVDGMDGWVGGWVGG